MSIPVMHSKVNDVYGPIEEVRAGIDWLSCTLPEDATGIGHWAADCIDIIAKVGDDGHAVQPFGLNGYKGVISGGCFYGKREDGRYMQLAGAYAQRFYRQISRSDLHISRLDMAVTVKFKTMPKGLGEDAYVSANEADRQVAISGRKRKIWYMSGTDGGYTLYIGAPTSDQRARIYNKEVQSDTPEYARCWRYEVVLRNKLATQQFESLFAVSEVYTPIIVSSVCWSWFLVRGIAVPWTKDTEMEIRPIKAQAPSDAEKRIKWLTKQVKPAVKWLIEHGYGERVYTALGLPE